LKEVKATLDSLALDKASGPDGFTTWFLQVCWPIIKQDLHKMVLKSQKCHKIGGSTNSTFLALIPKEKGASSFDRFHLISLCNTGYKIITKVIANRLKGMLPTIIPKNQGGFIKGRHIIENIILVQQAIHSSMQRGEKGMIVKLDLANAFDRVRHVLLFQVMKKYGFNASFIQWIKACIETPWIAPLVNGRATKFFQATRGIRQGCPLSPMLYAIQASALRFQLDHCHSQHELMGIKIARGVKDINHAQFVDDTLLLRGASTIIARKFKQQLDLYKEASGSQINYRKSKIFGWNYKPREMVEISRILEMEEETQWESFNYLGDPIFK
jgi:hypothetical protein